MKPLFSIILPSYNSVEYIDRCIKSILNQTFKNFEIIIIDNSSSDGTVEKIQKYKDSRIKLFNINNYGILAKSRNLGIKKSSGDWIAFLDSDDWWTKKKLDKVKELIEKKKECDLLYHNLSIYNPLKKINIRKKLFTLESKNFFEDLMIKGNFIPNSSVVVKKKLLIKVNGICEDKNYFASEDYNCWIKISKITNNFLFINEILGYYYVNPKGSSRRDMSIPYRYATKNFVKYLSSESKKKYYSHLFLLNFKFKKYISTSKFKYCLINGSSFDKFKLLLIAILFKININ